MFSSSISVMCQDWILFINDFSINKAPDSNGRKFYLTSTGSTSPNGSFGGSPTTGQDSKNTARPTSKSALSRMRLWAGGESKTRCRIFPSIYMIDCSVLLVLEFSMFPIMLKCVCVWGGGGGYFLGGNVLLGSWNR